MGVAAAFCMSFSQFDKGMSSADLKRREEQANATARQRDMFSRWQLSEHILTILRPVKVTPDEITPEAMEQWYAEAEKYPSPLQMDAFSSDGLGTTRIDTPNEWFRCRFPRQVKIFGQPFLEEIIDGRVSRPILLNSDFFCSILGGEKALGHQVVFVPSENIWYYHDPVVEAFCPTTTAKLQILASNYLIKCAESFSNKATVIPLLDDFRRPSILQGVTYKAKSILDADRTFFEGPQGKARMIDGQRLDPTSEPPHRLFVWEGMARQPGAFLTVTDAFSHYSQFCRSRHLPALRMVEFKNEVSATIQELFNIRLRHDVPGEDGRATHGWRDLACSFD